MCEIRRATANDVHALNTLFARTTREAQWLPADSQNASDFASVSEDETVLICVGEGQILGLISIYEPASFVHHLYVAPEHQRQGVGRALLGALRPWLPLPWRLKCACANTAALAFYNALGWKEAGSGSDDNRDYLVLQYDGV